MLDEVETEVIDGAASERLFHLLPVANRDCGPRKVIIDTEDCNQFAFEPARRTSNLVDQVENLWWPQLLCGLDSVDREVVALRDVPVIFAKRDKV